MKDYTTYVLMCCFVFGFPFAAAGWFAAGVGGAALSIAIVAMFAMSASIIIFSLRHVDAHKNAIS